MSIIGSEKMSEFIIAIHALCLLAHDLKSWSSECLSANLCTNPVRIRKVMSRCKKAGLVETKAGVNGGYQIVGNGKDINLKQIYEAIGQPLVESRWHSGNKESECMYASGMSEYIDGLFSYLNEEMVFLLEKITIEDIENGLRDIKDKRKG